MVKRKAHRPRSGPAARKRKTPQSMPRSGEGVPRGEAITAFRENTGAIWPTPDNLDDVTVTADQAGVEDIQGAGRPRRRR